MRFAKISLESDPCFLNRRKIIPVLDRFLELISLIDDFVVLQYHLRVRIGTVFHITVFEKVFDFVENIFNWGDRVIVHFGQLIF